MSDMIEEMKVTVTLSSPLPDGGSFEREVKHHEGVWTLDSVTEYIRTMRDVLADGETLTVNIVVHARELRG